VKQSAKTFFLEATGVGRRLADVSKDYQAVVSNCDHYVYDMHSLVPFLFGKRDNRQRMRCILQNVIIPGLLSSYDILSLPANVNHGIAKPPEYQTLCSRRDAIISMSSPVDLL
jgi:hypothetical protein